VAAGFELFYDLSKFLLGGNFLFHAQLS
jgi:hypothetical protein